MDTSPYFRVTQASDEALRARLHEIASDYEAGQITPREAADLRVAAMSRHLAACREARERFLGGAA